MINRGVVAMLLGKDCTYNVSHSVAGSMIISLSAMYTFAIHIRRSPFRPGPDLRTHGDNAQLPSRAQSLGGFGLEWQRERGGECSLAPETALSFINMWPMVRRTSGTTGSSEPADWPNQKCHCKVSWPTKRVKNKCKQMK